MHRLLVGSHKVLQNVSSFCHAGQSGETSEDTYSTFHHPRVHVLIRSIPLYSISSHLARLCDDVYGFWIHQHSIRRLLDAPPALKLDQLRLLRGAWRVRHRQSDVLHLFPKRSRVVSRSRIMLRHGHTFCQQKPSIRQVKCTQNPSGMMRSKHKFSWSLQS
nr:hypothetical protein CFP56_10061 [Quercus suber]